MSRLDEIDIKFLTGVGPKRAELLAEQLTSTRSTTCSTTSRSDYVDRSRIFQIRELESGMPFIQLKGRFVTMTTVGEGAKRRMQALFSDGTGTIDVVWFNRIKFVAENYRTGVEYVIFGRPSIFNGRFNLAHPEIETSVPGNEPHGLRGAYNLTDKLRKSMPEANDSVRMRVARLAQTIVFTSQGTPFMFAGEEIFRDKKGEHNSYCSPDSINAIDWNLKKQNREQFDIYRNLIAMRKRIRHSHDVGSRH